MTLWLKTLIPDALVMRKSSVLRRAIDTRTISPTFSCDHLTSCWLGIELLGDLAQKSRSGMSHCETIVSALCRKSPPEARQLWMQPFFSKMLFCVIRLPRLIFRHHHRNR